jgi:hypothetical protein
VLLHPAARLDRAPHERIGLGGEPFAERRGALDLPFPDPRQALGCRALEAGLGGLLALVELGLLVAGDAFQVALGAQAVDTRGDRLGTERIGRARRRVGLATVGRLCRVFVLLLVVGHRAFLGGAAERNRAPYLRDPRGSIKSGPGRRQMASSPPAEAWA